jgi:hypothetical protein
MSGGTFVDLERLGSLIGRVGRGVARRNGSGPGKSQDSREVQPPAD